jgi:hypothetical protein
MKFIPHALILCGLLAGQALFAQGSPAPGASSKSGYQYVDEFSGPAWAVDPKHPVDFEWPGRNSINDFRPEPRDIFHQMDQVVTPELDANGKPVLDANGYPAKGSLMPRGIWAEHMADVVRWERAFLGLAGAARVRGAGLFAGHRQPAA